ncbi:store-operated calcium entry-associated regulatory factor [Brienomyrus brachyistius]|uniref:store-operated calcium entry-associated regulatory factor n=1 Tax=Brienomyrus brachyistius TaxID=42636 RepID=UPI0020B190C3|nr:store-operated calcium entry-associated regulatory factor [Brienomyrus brachyistius]
MAALVFAVFLQFLFFRQIDSWNDGGSVLLRDVQALTLYSGRYTTARRTSPVLQLQCVGGSAGCGAFIPEVVQCQNKGWDGVDVQWECRTDMDNAYRFGKIEVSCEGFNHPDDPYILKGSCGLEYTLELTGHGRQGGHGSRGSGAFGSFGGFASNFFRDAYDGQRQQQGGGSFPQSSSGGDVGGLVVVGLFLLLAYGVYKMFLCGPTHNQDRFPDDAGYPRGASHMGPPPAGFKPDYSGSSSQCGGPAGSPGSGNQYGFREEFTRPGSTGHGSNSGTGFWSGLGAGGILGYLFGNQNRHQPGMHTGNSWNSGNSGNSWNSPKVQPGSTGTRTASGFGNTKRR